MKKHDLAIRWSNGKAGLARVRKLGGVVVKGYPNRIKIPGGKVAVVVKGGVVALCYRAASIVGPRIVRLAGGQMRRGYLIKAKTGSIHPPTAGETKKLGIRWYAVGQFRYFNARTGNAVLIDNSHFGSKDYLEDGSQKISFQSFDGGIPGWPRNHPEAKLVACYVAWLKDPEGFGHNYIRQAGLFVDLFDRRKWRLIEAKATTEREKVRMAVGQLLDYRRFYNRHPSLGLLLPSRPPSGCLDFLKANHIVAVWETTQGRFKDSTEMHAWTSLRRH